MDLDKDKPMQAARVAYQVSLQQVLNKQGNGDLSMNSKHDNSYNISQGYQPIRLDDGSIKPSQSIAESISNAVNKAQRSGKGSKGNNTALSRGREVGGTLDPGHPDKSVDEDHLEPEVEDDDDDSLMDERGSHSPQRLGASMEHDINKRVIARKQKRLKESMQLEQTSRHPQPSQRQSLSDSKVLDRPTDGHSDVQADQRAPSQIQALHNKYDQQSIGPLKKPNQDPRRSTWKERREQVLKEKRASQVMRGQSKILTP